MEQTISELAEAWKQLFLTEDEISFEEWGKKIKECESALYKEKRKTYLHYASQKYHREHYVPKPRPKHYNKPNSKHSDTEEYRKAYQKKYYQEVLKKKRQEEREQQDGRD